MRKNLIAILAAVILACAGVLVGGKLRSNPAAVDLTKDESLIAIRLQYVAETAVRDRNAYILELYTKYGLTEQTHQIDLASGRFVPIIKKPEAEKKESP